MEKFYVFTCYEYIAEIHAVQNRVVVFKDEQKAKKEVDDVYNFYKTKGLIELFDEVSLGYGYKLHLNNGDIIVIRCYEDFAE